MEHGTTEIHVKNRITGIHRLLKYEMITAVTQKNCKSK